MDRFEASLSRALVRWVREVDANARGILVAIAGVTVAFFVYAAMTLGINSDNVTLVAEHLPARQNYLEFARSFPNIENVMLVVVDGETPEVAREATYTLRDALAKRPDLFHEVYIPGSGDFFEKHGLLYRELDDLDEFALQIANAQPILTALEREPTVANLASLIQTGLEQADQNGPGIDELAGLLDQVGEATVEAYQEFPLAVSWEEILLRGSSVDSVTQWTIVVDPVLDFGSLFAAEAPMQEIRRIALENDLDPDRGVTIRLTGNPVLNYEEMAGLLWDIGLGGVITFFFVILVLFRALRSLRLVIASVVTLLVGLVWTGAFAAAAVGALNLISIAFAILFIGLGVDFAIHFGMAFAAERRDQGLPCEAAIAAAIDSIGASLVLCGFTTAIGFLVFWPTEYRGVAELGAIAGVGMFIILFLTLTLFPALMLGWLKIPDDLVVPAPTRVDRGLALRLARTPRMVVTIGVLAGLGALPLLLQLRFDAHVIEMRDPDTRSVQAFRDLLADGNSSPWYVNLMATDETQAAEVSRALEARPEVGRTVRLASYVPTDQEEKLEILEDLSFLMEAPPRGVPEAPRYSVGEQRDALRDLLSVLTDAERPDEDSPLRTSLDALEDRLRTFLARLERGDDTERALADFRAVLLERFPAEIARFRNSLAVSEVALEDLPEELVGRLRARDGTLRIQAYPEDELQDFDSLKRFVSSVLEVDPKAAGIAINLVEFGEATARSFRQALFSAAIAISALLFLLWRRPADVGLVLAPLALGSILTCASMAVIDMSFNFANVLVLPLLFGIGVDSGIHLVHRARHDAAGAGGSLVESATAGAVFYSAMTTTLSFGTLALSGHEGMHTLGVMLTIGMFFTVVANLVFLPALLVVAGVSKPTEAGATEADAA